MIDGVAIKQLKVSAHDKEVSLKAAHQQIAKYEKQRETAASKKELDAFEHEIAHNRGECAKFEEEIFAMLTEIGAFVGREGSTVGKDVIPTATVIIEKWTTGRC